MCRGLYNWLLSKRTLRSQAQFSQDSAVKTSVVLFFSIVFTLVASLLTMISRIQSSCKNGVTFEDAMTQVLSEILQNLQVTNEDTKKPRCRRGSVPAIWYATVEATEEKTTTLKKSSKVFERRFSEIPTSALSTMSALEEEKDSPKEIQVDSAEKRKEDEDVGGTSETTIVMQLKKEMKRKLSVFTAPALSTVLSLQSLDEEKVNIDEVDIGSGCQKQGSEEDGTEKLKEDEDIEPRGLISVPVRATLETTIPMQPKKKMGRKFSVFTAPALSATTSLQSLDEEKVSIDEDDIGFGYNDKVFQEVRVHGQRESDDMELRKRINAPVIGTSEATTLEQPKKEMAFSLFTAAALSATPSLQSLDEEEVNSDEVSIGMGCQVKVIDEDSAEKQRGDVGRRRRISAPVIGTSGTKTLKNKLKRKFSVFPAPALSATPSLQSLDEKNINIDKVDIGLSCQEVNAEKQREGVDIQRRRRRTSAPVKGTSETTTNKLPKKKTRRKFSFFAAPPLSATPSLKSLDEENVRIDNVDIGLGYNDRVIQTDTVTEKQPRRRRVSAPARTYGETSETTSFKQLKKDLVRKMSRPTVFPDVALPTMPWLADCVENQIEENFEPVEFNLSFLDNLMKSM